MQIYKDYSDAKGKIRRLVRKGDLIPIIKGIYEDNPKVDPSYLAPWIYSPSYLSFDYALYIYNIIPEAVYSYTSATFNKGKRLRKDIKTDGRHAIVEFTRDYKEDAKRRDFAFNAMYIDFNGKLYDYFNGLEDLINNNISFIGDAQKRIDEDNFRALNLNDILFLAPLYHSTNLKFLMQFIKRGI